MIKVDKSIILGIVCFGSSLFVQAQTSSDFLNAYSKADCTIPYDVKAAGKSLPVNWGMDTAWDDLYNVKWGVAHYGANFQTGRISFQPYELVDASKIDNASANFGLPTKMACKLKQRIDRIKLTGTTKVAINCDHEVLTRKLDDDGNYGETEDNVGVGNYRSTGAISSRLKTSAWLNLIKASVKYAQAQGLEVVSVSPFNEPDYGWNQYYNGGAGASESNQNKYGIPAFKAIAKAIKEDTFFKTGAGKNIRVCGGNTLNCDRASAWYEGLKSYIDEGNTHQLAGSFDNYASFFTKVRQDGKVATADELHNVGEAIVGAEYGMQNGIWWAFDAKARGQFMMDSNEGVRIGYGEDRTHWTSAAIYRNNKEGEVHGFIGTSERQANPSTYQFVSTTKDVYYNGYGPVRQWAYTTIGGADGSYQNGQINQELLFDITYGEDVAPFYVDGNYQIMNASTRTLLTTDGYWNGSNYISCKTQTNTDAQRWHVYPDNVKASGDCSYWFIDNKGDANQHLNLCNGGDHNNLSAGARVITYNASHDPLEQWYIRYAKNGYYYIMTRRSNKYIYCNNGTITLEDAPTATTSDAERAKYMWRFMPTDAPAETTAPNTPTGLIATPQTGSVKLAWNAISEAKATYTILRAEGGEWNTIGRGISETNFVDNSAIAGRTYIYKVLAVDYSGNRSAASAEVSSSVKSGKAMIMHLNFDSNGNDETENKFNAAFSANPTYDQNSVLLNNGNYGVLPYAVSNNDAMTIAMWIYWNSASNWQRVFDFGNGENQYMFFTPSNGSKMRFVMKNGGSEEILEGTEALATKTWKHVAITIGNGTATLYVDGKSIASKSMTIKPSDIAASLCYLGRSMYEADPLFNGYLDDVRIYNYALSADEVASVKDEDSNRNEPSIVDVTSQYIKNPGFENSDWAESWTNENFGNQTNNEKFTNVIAEMWSDGNAGIKTSGKIYQTITLPAGIYELGATATAGFEGQTYLYVTTSVGTEKAIAQPQAGDPAQNLKVKFVVPEGGQVTIGFARENCTWWSAVDDFKLTSYGSIPASYVQSGSFSAKYVYTENAGGEYVAIGRGANWNTQAIPTNSNELELEVAISNYVATLKCKDTGMYIFDAGGYNVYTDKADAELSTHFFLKSEVGGGYKFILYTDENYALGLGTDGDYSTLKLVATASAPVWHFGDSKANLAVSGTAQYGTFVAPFDVDLPENVTAYQIVNKGESSVTLGNDNTGTLEANTPVILKNTTGTTISKLYYGATIGTENANSDGYLVGVYREGNVSGGYALQYKDGECKFFLINGSVLSAANRAYLDATAFGKDSKIRIVFENEETAITFHNQEAVECEIYTLSGVRLNEMKKGVNLVKYSDGSVKKIMVK